VLTELRTKKGWTQRELATRMRTTQNFIAQVESGARRVDTTEFAEYVIALGEDPVEVYREVLRR
jgi:transcriptional regulator with XRE-family HTH domain